MSTSIEYFLRTWKVIQGLGPVQKGQRIEIKRRSAGGSNALKFVVPPALVPSEKKGFGDGRWEAVSDLRYENGSVIGTAKVDQDLNQIIIRPEFRDGSSRTYIGCVIGKLPPSISPSSARRFAAELTRYLGSRENAKGIIEAAVPQRLRRLLTRFEQVGEWDAEDDGG